MNTLEILRLVVELILGLAAVGGLKNWIDTKKYRQEVEKLKAEVQAAKINTRGNELENVKKAMDILMEQVVEPLKREINGFRKELARFRRVVEMANHCPHSAKCPVRDELQKSEVIESDPPPRQRQSATHKKIRDEPCAYPDERGNVGGSFD